MAQIRKSCSWDGAGSTSTDDLLAVARLKPGQSHFVPNVRSLPFNRSARSDFRVTRAVVQRGVSSPAVGVRVERVGS